MNKPEIPIAPAVETNALDLVDEYTSKTLSVKLGRELARRIAELARIHTSQMLTYGPDEVERIAREAGVDRDAAKRVIHLAGGRCTDLDGLRASWLRTTHGPSEFRARAGKLTAEGIDREAAVAYLKRTLHATRDTMRTKGIDTKTNGFQSNLDYGKVWGFLAALEQAGVGVLHSRGRTEAPLLSVWLRGIEEEVLKEEHFGGSGECDWCLTHYGKDDAGRMR